jgi:hypothetical protein
MVKNDFFISKGGNAMRKRQRFAFMIVLFAVLALAAVTALAHGAMPPSVFKGQTFDANIEEIPKGQRFSVRGPRNARLNQLIVEEPLPGGPPPGRLRQPKMRHRPSESLAWEILHVDARNWIVTAKNRRTNKVAKFQAHPEAFTGFLFHANLRGIQKGRGFAIVTPNNQPMNNVCTLLELK